MIYKAKNNFLIPLFVVAAILFVILLNVLVKPDLNIKTYCKVYPKEKWVLAKGDNGQIISSMIDFTKGNTVQYSLNQFERGEYVSLEFSQNLKSGEFINKGDTIASIISSEVESQLISAEGELDVAISNLETQNAGQKKSIIEETKNKLKYVEEKIKEQKILFKRDSLLYEKGLNSQQDYEIQKWEIDLLEIEKQIYKAGLDNVTTGVKEEEINLVKSQINSIKSRLDFLKNRKNYLTVISPISGFTTNIFSPDTLLTIINHKDIILNLPVKIDDLPLIKEGQNIDIIISDFDKEYKGLITAVSPEVKFLNSQQVVLVSVRLDNNDGKLLPGMVKESYLKIKQITFYEYIKRFFIS